MSVLQDKVVVVTGTASGIGAATAKTFAARGAIVVAGDINADGARATVEAITAEGGRATAHAVDVADPAALTAFVEQAAADHGRIDTLANVAGILQFDHTLELTTEKWDRTLAVNLSSIFHACKAALPHLLETKGAIVNVASTAGIKGQAYSAAYAASKGGVVMLTKALAVEYTGRGVRVNCVCPGGVATALTQNMAVPADPDWHLLMRMQLVQGHFSDPMDIASVLAFLGSDDGRGVSGAAWVVDLGETT